MVLPLKKINLVYSVCYQVREAVEKAVLFYNTERPHMSINMMTPQEAATHTGEIKKG